MQPDLLGVSGSQSLRNIIEPAVESLGYELVHVERTNQGSNQVLRVYIDAPGGILVDDCALVSRQLGLVLDVEDPISGNYLLEVSSPGIDRPLVTHEHFVKYKGQKIRVVMHEYVMGRLRFVGDLCEVADDLIVIEVDGEQYDLPFSGMKSARIEPTY